MDEKTLITQQALRIANLEIEAADYKKALKSIWNLLYNIGGPLNDNKHFYNRSQLSIFFKMSLECQVIADYDRNDDQPL